MSKPSPRPSRLSGIDRFFTRIEDGMNLFAAGAIFLLMFLAAIQVVGRKVFNMPIPGYIDFAEQSIAIFAFLGAAYCQRLGGHVRMELILDKFRGRLLWLLELITATAAFVIIAILAKYSFDHFLRAWQIGDSTIDINLPVWPSKLLVSVALMFLAIRLLIQVVGFFRLLKDPAKDPVAVPLIEDIQAQARQEIESGRAVEAATK
ncbi:MAG: TRAP transporter small permease subunit [Burkholderiaceae bacterium]